MSSVQEDIIALEERLRAAELGPDPTVFEELLADDAVLVTQDGNSSAKSKVVEAHQPGNGPQFTNVEMSDLQIIDHGAAAVVTCKGAYTTADASFSMTFMRVWVRKNDRWQIVAGSVSS